MVPSLAENPEMVIAINSETVNTPPVPAATVMVVRDGEQGLEVLLVRRHANSGVLGGVHVFPGGKLDAADRLVAPTALDRPVADCLQALGEADLDVDTAVGLHVAALRETFEECGLMLGDEASPDVVPRLREQTMNGTAFGDAVRALGFQLPVSCLLPWSRWVTPRVPSVTNKRFDTRFFVALAPPDQVVEHCVFEATEAVWLSPRLGLERFWAGEIALAPPQIMSLCQLSPLGSVTQVQAVARSRAPVLIAPEPFDVDGVRVICYPGDPSHSCADRAWPGPTRLIYRNQRFEPEGGLAALIP